jgi:hypothetical protein
MNPFEAYKLYTAIKNHFTTESYDYFKYNGKIRASEHTFETRKDKYMFYKLSKRDDALDYLVANLSEHPGLWVGELFDPKHELVYSSFKKRKESLTYVFKNDIEHLLEDFDSNFQVQDGDYPYLLKLLVQGKITKETFIIINDCVRFFGKWNKQISDPVLWPKIALNCKKLYPFLEYDKAKYCEVLRDKFS